MQHGIHNEAEKSPSKSKLKDIVSEMLDDMYSQGIIEKLTSPCLGFLICWFLRKTIVVVGLFVITETFPCKLYEYYP